MAKSFQEVTVIIDRGNSSIHLTAKYGLDPMAPIGHCRKLAFTSNVKCGG